MIFGVIHHFRPTCYIRADLPPNLSSAFTTLTRPWLSPTSLTAGAPPLPPFIASPRTCPHHQTPGPYHRHHERTRSDARRQRQRELAAPRDALSIGPVGQQAREAAGASPTHRPSFILTDKAPFQDMSPAQEGQPHIHHTSPPPHSPIVQKCDEEPEEGQCKTCKRLGIECLGWGSKRPDWMRVRASPAERLEELL